MIASRTAPARIGELKVMRLRRELRETGRVRTKDDENWTHFLPVVLLMPFGFHLAMDTLPPRRTNFILRPAGHYPRIWIWPSSSECQKDFNLPEQHAAQHTLRP